MRIFCLILAVISTYLTAVVFADLPLPWKLGVFGRATLLAVFMIATFALKAYISHRSGGHISIFDK